MDKWVCMIRKFYLFTVTTLHLEHIKTNSALITSSKNLQCTKLYYKLVNF